MEFDIIQDEKEKRITLVLYPSVRQFYGVFPEGLRMRIMDIIHEEADKRGVRLGGDFAVFEDRCSPELCFRAVFEYIEKTDGELEAERVESFIDRLTNY